MGLLASFVKEIEDSAFIRRTASAAINKLIALLFLVLLFSSKKMETRFNHLVGNLFNPILSTIGKPIGLVVNNINSYTEYMRNAKSAADASETIKELRWIIAKQQREILELNSVKGMLRPDHAPQYEQIIGKVLFFEGLGSKHLWARVASEKEVKPIVGSLVVGKHGLIGKVTQVVEQKNAQDVRVQLVSNSKFAISARKNESEEFIIIKGDGENSAFMAYDFQVNKKQQRPLEELTATKSEDLFTSPLDTINIPTVYIGKIKSGLNGQTIELAENLYTIEYISILSPKDGQLFKDNGSARKNKKK